MDAADQKMEDVEGMVPEQQNSNVHLPSKLYIFSTSPQFPDALQLCAGTPWVAAVNGELLFLGVSINFLLFFFVTILTLFLEHRPQPFIVQVFRGSSSSQFSSQNSHNYHR